MRNFIFILLLFLIASSCSKQILTINATNTLDISREGELVEVDLNIFNRHMKSRNFIIVDSLQNEIPYQLTYDKKLLLKTSFKPNETKALHLKKRKPSVFNNLTFGRFIEERKDDFAWENDRVAFRFYGPALLPVDGPSNGLDIWYKRTPKLVVDNWYQNDIAGVLSYHQDHGEGLDDYKVGRSLGAGAMAPYLDKKLILNENYTSWELYENGPLRTTFILNYPDIKVGSETVSESRIISIDAGSQFSKITQVYNASKPLPVAAGIVQHGHEATATLAADSTFVIYPEPPTLNTKGVYVAVVNPTKWHGLDFNEYQTPNGSTYKHALALSTCQTDKPLVYYSGYGWEKQGFASQNAFEKYIINYVLRIQNPLIIQLVK